MDLFLFWGGIVTIVANASKNISHLGSIIIFFLHQVDFLEDVLVSLLLGTDASLVLRFLLQHSSKSFFFSIIFNLQGCCLGLLGCFTGMASLLEIVTLIWVDQPNIYFIMLLKNVDVD